MNTPEVSQNRSKRLPILKWAGGKAALSQTILPVIRQNLKGRYIEPFLGSAAIFFKLRPRAAILGDTNSNLMRLFYEIKRRPVEVHSKLEALADRARGLEGPAFIDFYYECRNNLLHKDPLSRSALFVFLNRHCWNGLYRENSEGQFNTPIGSHHSLQPLPTKSDFQAASEDLLQASLQLDDFENLLRLAKPGDFLYLDPPYVPVSSTARFVNYQANSFNWHDQIRLKKALYELTDKGIYFMLLNGGAKGTALFYKDFNVVTLGVARPINSVASRRSGQSEILVTNFEWRI